MSTYPPPTHTRVRIECENGVWTKEGSAMKHDDSRYYELTYVSSRYYQLIYDISRYYQLTYGISSYFEPTYEIGMYYEPTYDISRYCELTYDIRQDEQGCDWRVNQKRGKRTKKNER